MEIMLDDKRIIYLSNRDKRLAKVIQAIGPIKVSEHNDEFSFIVCEIIGQMLSNKVADVMIDRLSRQCGGLIIMETIKDVGADGLKSIGLSSAKVSYIQNMIGAIELGELNFDDLREKDDETIIKELKKIKGIGNWTAKMYLLFVLRRENILPYEDGAFLQGYKWLYKTGDVSKDSILRRCNKWEPYSSLAARYMYKAVDFGLTKYPFHLYKDLEGIR